eukprot:CAMPEP_0198333850 /NCGR_PEP_ID=MMETSP1450-20131203/19228_1 /TAXON_ID=753684 ORGANISM="Madagascaria erythrocladiodes, Strain CCMP3234" /NCGR_SAMPLE_ID=MMETSP1450 /ASSEMBLY_ACC=CAM_ASM_001115 /LENGTH=61 /DNA_ID=CAMNT_0044038397 /DNA_START=57 /DNA_END=238 /DNA_ORIENTATION=-
MVVHCHVLSHEDNGAMGWIQVGGNAPLPGVGQVSCDEATSAPTAAPGTAAPTAAPDTPAPT